MNEVYGLLGTPGVGFFTLLIIGALAGWIAEKITKSDHGILTNVVVGIAGSFVGSTLATSFNIAVSGGISRLIAAVVGAVIVVYAWRLIKGRNSPQQQQGQGQPVGYDNNTMPPQDGQQGQYGGQQGQYGGQQGQYGNQQQGYGGQQGQPQGEWIDEPPPGHGQGHGQGQGGQPYDNQPPPNNSPLDRR